MTWINWGGTRCHLSVGGPDRVIVDENGKRHKFEMHPYAGPILLSADGDPAGKGAGFDDERHLWPAFHWLIEQCRPAVILGEQVASKDADPWIDLVQADMEGMAYAFGAVPFPSAGVGAPHIRDRLYWMAHASLSGRGEERADAGRFDAGDRTQGLAAGSVHGGGVSGMADADMSSEHTLLWRPTEHPTEDVRRGALGGPFRHVAGGASQHGRLRESEHDGAGPTNGFWGTADWLLCRDKKWRPVEPFTFPLADGAPARVGRLRAYGNAINAIQAQVFIEEVMECLP